MSYYKWLFKNSKKDMCLLTHDIVRLKSKFAHLTMPTETELAQAVNQKLDELAQLFNANSRTILWIERIYEPLDRLTPCELEQHWKKYKGTIDAFQSQQRQIYDSLKELKHILKLD